MQHFCKPQKVHRGPCGTSASMKKEKVVFAELPQASKSRKWCLRNFRKHEKEESGVCGTSANVKMEKTALAELLQAPKRRKWPLQNFCKRQKGENGLCRTSANVKMEKMAFAGLLQAPKRRKWPLQNFCKHFQKRFGPRVASVKSLCRFYAYIELTLRVRSVQSWHFSASFAWTENRWFNR